MLPIDLRGKRALVCGVADDQGFGFAIAKALAEAEASVCVGTWPPAYGIFTKLLERGKLAPSLALAGGGTLEFERIYALDAEYDSLEQTPLEVRENRRYKAFDDFTIQGVADRMVADFGEKPLDIVVHAIARGSEVQKRLLETSRAGYLGALGASAYSFVALVQRFAPILRPHGAFLNLTYMASERVIPGYGGGMSSAKAALESDTRVLAYDVGRQYGLRVNAISAGPYASRAASAIGFIELMIQHAQQNSPLPRRLRGEDVGATAAFLCSPLAAAITGSTVYVDHGYHAMGMSSPALDTGA